MPKLKKTLCLENYDCIGFDLDHTLCRYNVGPMVRLEFDLLAEFLVEKKGYDPAIRAKDFDQDLDFVCKGLTLDCERGNLLRLHYDGFVLAACHGTKRLSDQEIERIYGRCRKQHPGHEFSRHLRENGPQKLIEFSPLLHSFMDYFDIAAPLLCARVVDVLDQINNGGKPMEEYFFWPDIHEGLKDMFLRTNFASDQGGYFPELKAHPEKYILKRSPEFREWLKMLRANGKYLYVITGSHFDFASHVASYALGDDWKDLFDIVIFFARKPSFFVEKRPFWRLEGAKEVESLEGWEDLETGDYYSQGNWNDLNEFFEYATEWQPSTSLYFGDNVMQDVLAPKKFTTTVDCIAVSEELIAEGMVNHPPSHEHTKDIVSTLWGSYFFYPDSRIIKKKGSVVMGRASSFRNWSNNNQDSTGTEGRSKTPRNTTTPTSQAMEDEVNRAMNLRRVASLKKSDPGDPTIITPSEVIQRSSANKMAMPGSSKSFDGSVLNSGRRSDTPTQVPDDLPKSVSADSVAELVKGTDRINTLWGCLIRDYAKMCIPDVEVFVDYPIDFKFPAFGRDKNGALVGSGFFPAEPLSLHTTVPIVCLAD